MDLDVHAGSVILTALVFRRTFLSWHPVDLCCMMSI